MQSRRLADMFKGQAFRAASILLSVYAGLVQAAELTDLYQARVPAGLSQAQWQRQALQDVLLKLTGSTAAFSQPGLAEPLKNSGQFVVQFQQVQQDGQSQLLVTLDGQKITQLLQTQQIPVWGPRRPDVLLWLTERPVETPQFVMSPEHPLRKALMQQGARYGLSLQFPLYDETDLTQVNETASWGGDWALLHQASGRYQATEVHNLLFDQLTDANGLVQFRLTWQQLVDGTVQSKEFINADAMALAQQFCAEMAAAQAARYAVRVSTAADPAVGNLQLTFAGVNNLTDLAALRRLFNSMLTVREHHLVQYSAGEAVLELQLSASNEEFYRALSLIRELTPQAEPVAADAGTLPIAEQSTPVTQNNSMAVDAPNTIPEVTDAEAAMEAALAAEHSDTTVNPAVPATGQVASALVGQNSANTALVISSRYLFRRQ